MHPLQALFDNNRAWSQRMRRSDPEFFARLSRQQSPRFLWIGCADSRVPANDIVGLLPGELFVQLLVTATGRHRGSLPAERAFVTLSPQRYVLTSIKKAEDSSAWIVQGYDAGGEDGTAELTLPFTPCRVTRSNFLEDDGTEVPFEGNVVRIASPKNAVVTLRVEIPRG